MADPTDAAEAAVDQNQSQGEPAPVKAPADDSQKSDDSSKTDTNDEMKTVLAEIAKLKSENHGYREKARKNKELSEKQIREEAEKQGKFQELYQQAQSKTTELEAQNKKYADLNEAMLKESLGVLTAEQVTDFEELFGDVTDPILKLSKLQKWTKKHANSPNSQTSTPASQVNNDPWAALNKEKTDLSDTRNSKDYLEKALDVALRKQ